MGKFGKKSIYDSEYSNIGTRGGCNCAAACNGHCTSCSCSGGLWSSYSTQQSKGAATYPATNYRSPTGI